MNLGWGLPRQDTSVQLVENRRIGQATEGQVLDRSRVETNLECLLQNDIYDVRILPAERQKPSVIGSSFYVLHREHVLSEMIHNDLMLPSSAQARSLSSEKFLNIRSQR